jgi:hypothetical protein
MQMCKKMKQTHLEVDFINQKVLFRHQRL